jgi:hypothetical protein
MEWVNARDHFPGRVGEYLGYFPEWEDKYCVVMFSYSKEHSYHWDNRIGNVIPDHCLSHWMPLPEPPKEEA